MTKYELGKILNKMCFCRPLPPKGEKVATIHLFGIKHANDIKKSGATYKEIADLAGIQPSYATEISKGVILSKYVKIVRHV